MSCPGVPPLALALAAVWLVSLVQLTGIRHSGTFQLISTILQVALIVAFLIAGTAIGNAAAGPLCRAWLASVMSPPPLRSASSSDGSLSGRSVRPISSVKCETPMKICRAALLGGTSSCSTLR